MEFDPFLLARLQFAANISFHILFPTITIGLCWVLFYFRLRYTFSGDKAWEYAYFFWVKIFALSFALGVVSGITMSFQFGTNWPGFMERAGNIAGPLLGYEVLTAFFLEASFLGIMLFGKDRVSNRTHLIATALVAVGTSFSAFWILSLNSWMQTPTGYRIEDGVFFVESWWEVIFNPSFPYRLAHTVTAAYLTTAFIVGGVGAYHLLKSDKRSERAPGARKMFSMAMWMAAIVAPIQVFLGDAHGLNTLEHQPQKVMAMEGHYDSHPDGAPLILFGIPNEAEKRIDYAIEIPKLSSLILKHGLNEPLAGLDTIPDDEEPPVTLVFFAFRIMIALGFLMVGIGFWSLWARYRGTLYSDRLLHRVAMVAAPSGLVAVIAGWITTEVGRQPYTVYGLLKTADSVSPLSAGTVGATLLGFIVVYFAAFGAGTFYVLRLMKKGPAAHGPDLEDKPDAPIRTAGITPGPAIDPNFIPAE